MPSSAFASSLESLAGAAIGVPNGLDAVKALDDGELVGAADRLAEIRTIIDASLALIAGEVSYRSRRELGHGGLAQRSGYRTPQALLQHHTGSTAREAIALVNIGEIVHDASTPPPVPVDLSLPVDPQAPPPWTGPREPWLVPVGDAVRAGELSVEAARAIRSGLGVPDVGIGAPGHVAGDAAPAGVAGTNCGVTVADLARAVTILLAEAPSSNADQLLRRARDIRDDLDEAGIAAREQILHTRRSFRRILQPSGLYRYIIDPDLESAAFFNDVYDKATSPRRGGSPLRDRVGPRVGRRHQRRQPYPRAVRARCDHRVAPRRHHCRLDQPEQSHHQAGHRVPAAGRPRPDHRPYPRGCGCGCGCGRRCGNGG